MTYRPPSPTRRYATLQLAAHDDFLQVGDRTFMAFEANHKVAFVGYFWKVLTPGTGASDMIIDIRLNEASIIFPKISFDAATTDSGGVVNGFSLTQNPYYTLPQYSPYIETVVEQSHGTTDPKGVFITIIYDDYENMV